MISGLLFQKSNFFSDSAKSVQKGEPIGIHGVFPPVAFPIAVGA
jgi:hypothetical protein